MRASVEHLRAAKGAQDAAIAAADLGVIDAEIID